MPIHGLTDRGSADTRYPLVGRLYKGAPKPTDRKGSGKDLPYFRFVGATEAATTAWIAAFTDQAARIRAYLPYQTVEENWSTWIEAWNPGNGRLMWRSDGERTCRIWLPEEKTYSDRYEDQVAHAAALTIEKCKDWAKPVGRLSLVFPELLDAGCVGVVSLTTHGIFDLSRISGALYKLESDCKHRDRGIAYIEIALERRAVQRPDPSGKKWTHYDVFLFPSESYVIAQLEDMRQGMVAQLPPGTTVIDDETGEVLEQTPKREEVIKSEPKAEKVPEKADTILPEGLQEGPTGKAAKVKNGTKTWTEAGTKLAEEYPYYAKNGLTDWYHIVGAAGKCGVIEINDANVGEVIGRLIAYAARNTAAIPEKAISRDEESDPAALFDADDVPF